MKGERAGGCRLLRWRGSLGKFAAAGKITEASGEKRLRLKMAREMYVWKECLPRRDSNELEETKISPAARFGRLGRLGGQSRVRRKERQTKAKLDYRGAAIGGVGGPALSAQWRCESRKCGSVAGVSLPGELQGRLVGTDEAGSCVRA